ncbi:indolepyruvate ferredoxin oxidoreductase family protein [Inhella gelatinilytica]|uniref:Indolepyruvate ferredoxin oxidoreductase family protein n=1 Tax=Inhella gelatinilytica TaxID=2795030 RepID=A0A931IUT9_9BURK|nr:indolepyruvate ferredoxin oxidoreductase family protein [Inhella gelatinilytica]
MSAQPASTDLRPYQLSDNLSAPSGAVFLTGTQALVRLTLMQKQADDAAGLSTAGFVSGYRGSPLGMVDQQMWKAKKFLTAASVEFLPAINEDLAATACLGTQRLALDPERKVEGVFAMWYGKGPGVDRAGDALKHGHIYGSSAQGGVLVVCGDDHGCVSSSTPHQSDLALQAWHMPLVHPGNVAEYLEFGLWGWAASRYSGAWVGFKAISEVVESGMTVDLDAVKTRFAVPTDHTPAVNLHVRLVDLPSLELESRLTHKLDAIRAFARANPLDRLVVAPTQPRLGIVTVGKAHYDFLEVLRRLGLSLEQLAQSGVAVYKVGLVYPLEPLGLTAFATGLTDILVIEEKAPVVERQLKELCFHWAQRPAVVGKTGTQGERLLSDLGELRPSRVMGVLADWLARLAPELDRREHVVDFTAPQLLSNSADAVRRLPYFCSGCPHNTSTKLPEGSRALAGIGCHFMANWMERSTSGLVQMGAEGVDWVAQQRFSRAPHVFQNLGDGTYYHSGYLAIRQAVAAKATLTYKILYNDAVAMTGGQPVDGSTSVPQIARQIEAEGVKRVVVVSDEIDKYDDHRSQFPPGTTFHDRSELDAVQRELRDTAGVTALIYDQTCAAEKRRRRKKKEFPDPPRRIFINEQVCEGCGDCGQASNCLSVVPVETDWGRKRAIEQTSCNKDFSCVNGFCPSFVSVDGAVLKKRQGASFSAADVARELAAIGEPAAWNWTGPFDMLVTGVGGTGVVTVGALITMAAHLEKKSASVLDFMGFAQKGGAVLSFVRVAPEASQLNQVRIDTQQADVLLACDLVVGASNDALQTVKAGRTMILANTHELPTAAFVRNPDASLQAHELLAKMRFATGQRDDLLKTVDAQTLAQKLLGDTMPSNIIMLGAAWQAGLVPVSLAALTRAIELNGVAVEANKTAFALGRLAHAAPAALDRLGGATVVKLSLATDKLDGEQGLIARRKAFLTDYQDAAYAERYEALVRRVREAESRLGDAGKAERLTKAVARYYAKLLAIKDEYEVARLYTNGSFEAALKEQFESWDGLRFHMAPPVFSKPGADGRAKKITYGGWMWKALRGLARFKGLRGSALDLFGYTAERRMERQLVADYETLVQELILGLRPDTLDTAVQLARLPERIRGYGHVKHANVEAVRQQGRELLARYRAPAAAQAA